MFERFAVYIEIAKFKSLESLSAYPMDIILFIIRRATDIFFFAFFWTLIAKNSNVNMNYIISYFLISGSIAEITLANSLPVGKKLMYIIRDGELSNYLVKPTSAVFSIYFNVLGSRLLAIVIAFISIIIGLFFYSNLTIFTFLFFILALIFAMAISLALNVVLGILTFIVTTNGGIHNVTNQIVRLLAGILVPISFFPPALKQVLSLLPFSFAVSAPTLFFFNSNLSLESFTTLGIGLFWAIVANIIVFYLWHKAEKKYEAIGI